MLNFVAEYCSATSKGSVADSTDLIKGNNNEQARDD